MSKDIHPDCGGVIRPINTDFARCDKCLDATFPISAKAAGTCGCEREPHTCESEEDQRIAELAVQLADAEREIERLGKACSGEPHACDQERVAAAEGRTDRLVIELAECNAQLDATRTAIGAECVEHAELSGHIDLAEQCRDWLCHEMANDPSGKQGDFVTALRIVIDQLDRQRRRANWYETAYTAGKQKLIESAVERALSRARAAAQVYAERVDALGLAADDNDPLVMASAGPVGEAQADLYAVLGLFSRSASGEIVTAPPTETVEQLRAERDAARMLAEVRGRERDRLNALINTLRTDEFFESVRIEAAHQVERWGVEHDAGKRPEDWITLFIYLLGKAATAHFDGNQPKLEHHVITVAAVALNWHRRLSSVSFAMRPGVAGGAT